MQSQLKIPNTLKVGFQKRGDTYSGKLAFVVYEDKGKIAKEKSWKGWISDKIPVETYENVPTDGFVLNRDVGGARRSYGWNPRMEKVRVYDPRGFEFEITTANLLFILQECSSIKGKGLEGQFVYSWDGKDLVLLPCSSTNYQTSLEFTELQKMKFNRKDIVEGCVYKFKNQTEGVYLGQHTWFEEIHGRLRGLGEKVHVFELRDVDIPKPDFSQYEDNNWYGWDEDYIESFKNAEIEAYEKRLRREKYVTITSFSKIAKRLTETPVEDYADRYTTLTNTSYVSEIDHIVLTPVDNVPRSQWYYENRFVAEKDGQIFLCQVDYAPAHCGYWAEKKYSKEAWRITVFSKINIKDGKYSVVDVPREDICVTEDPKEVKSVIRNAELHCKNGAKFYLSF